MDALTTAWSGQVADFVSLPGQYGEVPWSELAVHTRQAGRQVTRYATWNDPERGTIWAQVETDRGVLDGTPYEVLPWEIRKFAIKERV